MPGSLREGGSRDAHQRGSPCSPHVARLAQRRSRNHKLTITPQRYKGLSGYFVPSWPTQRSGLLSEDKPHGETHRRSRSVTSATVVSDICLENALHYAYYDEHTGCFVDDVRFCGKLETLCMYSMPAASASLQQFLYRPAENASGPSPNTAIASLSACPDHFTEQEYTALCTIPLGYRIQWQNILVQLHAPAADLKKVETLIAMLQCMLQAGPRSDVPGRRASHIVMDEARFAAELLEGLDVQFQHIKTNWQACHAMNALICIGCRLHTLVTDSVTRVRCLRFLESCRTVALDWLDRLQDETGRAAEENARAAHRSRAVTVAMICCCTFDVDQDTLGSILSLPKDACIFIRCAIVIREGQKSLALDADVIAMLQCRVQKLQHRSYSILSRYILGGQAEALDSAIRLSWPVYKARRGWRPLPTHDYWLHTRATNEGTTATLQVHFNLLDGDLRVDGVPLGHLPDEYERHPTYCELFGRAAIEVMPSPLPGMRFSAKKEFHGHELHFGMAGNDLLLRVSQGKGDCYYELVPRRLLCGYYPALIVQDHVHWYDGARKRIEFRSKDTPWTAPYTGWVLGRYRDNTWQLQNNGCLLLPLPSRTAMLVSKPLEPLEDLPYMHTVLQQSATLELHLPRLQLEFSVLRGTGRLDSRQYRGMFVDAEQSAGTFIGLENKVVLRGDGDCPRRIVLVPNGTVTFVRSRGHVRVSIRKGARKRVESYQIKARLGQLLDRGSQESMLYQCYLHALTAFCLPDPLTRTTGTEQALSILDMAAVHSFDSLSEASISLLRHIADLTPARNYYPAHERCMQVVDWSDNLGFLAQHSSFGALVRTLFNKHDDMKIFATTHHAAIPSLCRMNANLLKRDMNRSSAVRISGFGAEEFSADRDAHYSRRGAWQDSPAARRTFSITSLLRRRSPHPFYKLTPNLVAHVWSYLQPFDVHPTGSLDANLEYDAGWLTESKSFISKNWLRIHKFLSWGGSNTSDVVMWLATLAFAENADISAIHILACFHVTSAMAAITRPRAPMFYIGRGFRFDEHELRTAIRAARYPLLQCPDVKLTRAHKESVHTFRQRQTKALNKASNPICEEIIKQLRQQWPCEQPRLISVPTSAQAYFDIGKAMAVVKKLFKYWYDNDRFRQYLNEVSSHVNYETVPLEMGSPSSMIEEWALERRQAFVTVADIFSHEAPILEPFQPLDIQEHLYPQSSSGNRESTMTALIDSLRQQAECPYERKYVRDLESSSRSAQGRDQKWKVADDGTVLATAVSALRDNAQARVDCVYSAMLQSIGVSQAHDKGSMQKWPRIAPLFFLQQLSRNRWPMLPAGWKDCIVEYGRAITMLQRAERLSESCGDAAKLTAEMQNPGHTNWNPRDHPEWLLLEVENGILVRETQHRIAKHMSTPEEGMNQIMQLIMGGGKSSVIVPLVASALADGSRLVRILVAKPQARQMFAMLVAKLGRLLNRRILLMPFSRSVRVGRGEMDVLDRLYRHCMATGGVLLVQPEHILSFQLMAIEKTISGATEGQLMLQTLQFLHEHARDIIDESDEILSVKYELVYTMGTQRSIDHAPARWIVISEVLDVVRKCVPEVQERCPEAIEVYPGNHGCFPRTRILQHEAMVDLQKCVVARVCGGGLTGFPITQQSAAVRTAVGHYISKQDLTEDERNYVEVQSKFMTNETRDTILLLRGLLALGILSFILEKKRWRVDYGLDSLRPRPTRLAVPFRAKDLPTDRSEFSHPDVVIALTSLSYYYAGLSDDDLVLSIRHLQQSDQADMEYQDWVKDAYNLPVSLQQLVSINLEDRHRCVTELFPCFRYSKSVIDYFLAHIVFPKEMKEFPHKLSASGWDIAVAKNNPTTGFSGTNDSRVVLPLSMHQVDLDLQRHTNALVLEYLLQPENSALPIIQASDVAVSDAERLLYMVTTMTPPVRVVLDVGAQILELDNLGVVQKWLSMLPDAEATQAAVFVDKDDHICVLDRKGYVEPLHTSPFATQLDVCVVFLDEAHTRGIDLVLPRYYRAAVTLGANLTKDRLVQACMRMRRLGHGQSVVFCVPKEICSKMKTVRPTVANILQWAIQGTWEDVARSVPLWAVQGRRRCTQSELWRPAQADDGTLRMTEAQARKFLEEEALSIRALYEPRAHYTPEAGADQISQRFHEFKPIDHFSAAMSEEQERELSPEIERQREVQRARPEKPAPHYLHPDIVAYVATGFIASDSSAHMPAFTSLSSTSAAQCLDLKKCPRNAYVSRDFAQTVEGGGSNCTQRPVQWILVNQPQSKKAEIDKMIVISPFEAQNLLPSIERSSHVALCLYSPRPNKGYRALDALDLYTVPEQRELSVPLRLTTELNIFAGQLYFSSIQECMRVCHYLGIRIWDIHSGDADDVGVNAALLCHSDCFTTSPVKFLQLFLSQVRRGCGGIGKTDMGCILDFRRPNDL